ncbi:hypothetical protein ACIPEQ_15675 [Curtobacterium sp. NPDC087080]
MTDDGVASIGIPHNAGNKRVRNLDGQKSRITMALIQKHLKDLE